MRAAQKLVIKGGGVNWRNELIVSVLSAIVRVSKLLADHTFPTKADMCVQVNSKQGEIT